MNIVCPKVDMSIYNDNITTHTHQFMHKQTFSNTEGILKVLDMHTLYKALLPAEVSRRVPMFSSEVVPKLENRADDSRH